MIMTKNKITIIGAGMVGSTTAFSLVENSVVEEVALFDINSKLAKAQVMDIQHAAPFCGSARIKIGDYKDCRDSKIAIITCGANQKIGETRLDLIKKNSLIIKEIVPKIFKENPKIILIMVTNPVDILTYEAIKMFPSKKKQIIGTGTILDSARLRHLIGEKLNIGSTSIHSYIVGEHGDSELPLWSTAAIGNSKLLKWKSLSDKDRMFIFSQARNAAYAIIEGKQATYFAIAAGVAYLSKVILNNKRLVLSVSHLIEGEFGIKDVCLSLPVVIGSEGIVSRIDLDISGKEKRMLQNSARVLKEAIKKL